MNLQWSTKKPVVFWRLSSRVSFVTPLPTQSMPRGTSARSFPHPFHLLTPSQKDSHFSRCCLRSQETRSHSLRFRRLDGYGCYEFLELGVGIVLWGSDNHTGVHGLLVWNTNFNFDLFQLSLCVVVDASRLLWMLFAFYVLNPGTILTLISHIHGFLLTSMHLLCTCRSNSRPELTMLACWRWLSNAVVLYIISEFGPSKESSFLTLILHDDWLMSSRFSGTCSRKFPSNVPWNIFLASISLFFLGIHLSSTFGHFTYVCFKLSNTALLCPTSPELLLPPSTLRTSGASWRVVALQNTDTLGLSWVEAVLDCFSLWCWVESSKPATALPLLLPILDFLFCFAFENLWFKGTSVGIFVGILFLLGIFTFRFWCSIYLTPVAVPG